jgi:hypothetical protein
MIALIRAAVDRGVTLFDTAEAYGPVHRQNLVRGKNNATPRRERSSTTRELNREHSADAQILCGSSLWAGPAYMHILRIEFLRAVSEPHTWDQATRS